MADETRLPQPLWRRRWVWAVVAVDIAFGAAE